jgi:hypothetical protein
VNRDARCSECGLYSCECETVVELERRNNTEDTLALVERWKLQAQTATCSHGKTMHEACAGCANPNPDDLDLAAAHYANERPFEERKARRLGALALAAGLCIPGVLPAVVITYAVARLVGWHRAAKRVRAGAQSSIDALLEEHL